VRVWSEQDRDALGTIQVDLVEHCGNSARGEFCNTISTTDISTGWWEGEAVMGKAQERVHEGIKRERERYPFNWRELHIDNGTEFLNNHLMRYCTEEKLEFSRSRPYKKNDNCLVEQKNWTHVRKLIGYLRYDTEYECEALNDLYRNELRLFKNCFQPVMKLSKKERVGGKIHREYDEPRTPYERVMESSLISTQTKRQLKKLYESLNPAELKRTIDRKLTSVYRAYQKKQRYTASPEVHMAHKKLSTSTVSFFIAQSKTVSVS
jgi:hypothetical protein